MTAIELSTLQATKVVDARAMACPGPLLEAKKASAPSTSAGCWK
jgi:TusA-related sulfurtransferase